MSDPPDDPQPGRHLTRRQALIIGAATVLPVSIAATALLTRRTGTPAVRVTVDLGKVVGAADPTFAGIALSTFGRPPTDPVQGLAERTVDARYMRIPVRWTGTAIVSSATGAQNAPVEPSIQTYYSRPGVRMLLVIAGRDDDWAGYQPDDAAAIVRRLRFLGMSELSRFDFSGPNEPDRLGVSMTQVADRCAQIADELRAAGTDGRVWGPVWSNAADDFGPFIRRVGPARLAGLDWHFYPGGRGQDEFSVRQVLDRVAGYGAIVDRVLGQLADGGAAPAVNVDELNWSWQMGNAPALFTAANTVMVALAFGTILSRGGRCLVYATQNGELSVMADSYGNPNGRPQSSPMPAYWGLAAFTGANLPGEPALFPHYRGTFFATDSNHPDIRVFAVDNEGNGLNFLVINISEFADHPVDLSIAGSSGLMYRIFQTRRSDPYNPPVALRPDTPLTGTLEVDCPALTVTVVVLGT
jgi:hypothetical protein